MSEDETYLLLYTFVEDMIDRRVPYREAHMEHIGAEKAAGHIVMSGALGAPPTGGAIAFRGVTPADIEAFTAADPYVRAGLVTNQRIERWNVVA